MIFIFMILLRELISENIETIQPKDIYNFFYLWYICLHYPDSIGTPYGSEISNYYIKELKQKYINLFTQLMINQLKKYEERNRIDNDYPRGKSLLKSTPAELLSLMKKTTRSKRAIAMGEGPRNSKWEMVGEFLLNLYNSNNFKDTFLMINQLLNALHNTNTKIIDKLPNYFELQKALDIVHKARSLNDYKQYVDKDLRELLNQ